MRNKLMPIGILLSMAQMTRAANAQRLGGLLRTGEEVIGATAIAAVAIGIGAETAKKAIGLRK